MPLARRLPKRGFNNKRFGTVYIPVNLDSLNQFEDGARVDEAALRDVGLLASLLLLRLRTIAREEILQNHMVQKRGV